MGVVINDASNLGDATYFLVSVPLVLVPSHNKALSGIDGNR